MHIELIGSIETYRSEVQCIAVNERFHSIVCGTGDGFILFGKIGKRGIEKAVNIDGIPGKILITKSWGFIVVSVKKIEKGQVNNKLIVLNQEGMEIRQKAIKNDVKEWITYQTNDDFDRILMCDVQGKIFTFDVYNLDIGNLIEKCLSEVVTLKFIPKEDVIYIVQKDGTILTYSVNASSSIYITSFFHMFFYMILIFCY